MRMLGYSPAWFQAGILDARLLEEQVAEFQAPTGDKNTEHYRFRAFHAYLQARTDISDSDLQVLLEIGASDQTLTESVLFELVKTKLLTLGQLGCISAQSTSPAFQAFVRRHSLLLRLENDPTSTVLDLCISDGDKVVQERLFGHQGLQRGHLLRLVETGASRSIRNQAKELLANRRFRLSSTDPIGAE